VLLQVYFTLSAVDVIHHVVSVGILGPLAVWYRPGSFLNYVCFFVSGLPGGVDYAMLALVKHGEMPCSRPRGLSRFRSCRASFGATLTPPSTHALCSPRAHAHDAREVLQLKDSYMDPLW
jgi:hypothetical protein